MRAKQTLLRTVTVSVLLFALLTIAASAATFHKWGPQYFTPYTGVMGAYSDGVLATDMYWSAEQITSIKNAGGIGFKTLEFEFRPFSNVPGNLTKKVDPRDIWYNDSSKLSFISNYPSSYMEFDEDDVAVCCARAVELVADQFYYGIISMEIKPGITTTNRYVLFESEFGRQIVVGDSLPYEYEQVFNRGDDSDPTAAKTYFDRNYAW